MQNLRAQLQNNKSNAVSQLKIRHHMLVLNLDNLLEQALEEVFSSEGKQLERIEGAMKEVADRLGDVEACTEMVDLKSRAEKKTKFV